MYPVFKILWEWSFEMPKYMLAVMLYAAGRLGRNEIAQHFATKTACDGRDGCFRMPENTLADSHCAKIQTRSKDRAQNLAIKTAWNGNFGMPRQTLAEIHCAGQPDEGVMTEV